MLQFILYLIIYVIGVTLGSFFTLATYRIPLKQNIIYTRSYCPNCNNKLKFWDLIPILSYIFLGGKCRYCHKKIKPRYIIIEATSGLFYLLFVMSLKLNIWTITTHQIVKLVFDTIMISTLFILGGIAKESKMISKGTIAFGVIVQAIYMIYLYIFKMSIYRHVIYICAIISIFLLEKLLKNKKQKSLLQFMIIMLFGINATNELVFLTSIIISTVIYLIKSKKDKTSIIYYFSFANIIFLILYNFIVNYILKVV